MADPLTEALEAAKNRKKLDNEIMNELDFCDMGLLPAIQTAKPLKANAKVRITKTMKEESNSKSKMSKIGHSQSKSSGSRVLSASVTVPRLNPDVHSENVTVATRSVVRMPLVSRERKNSEPNIALLQCFEEESDDLKRGCFHNESKMLHCAATLVTEPIGSGKKALLTKGELILTSYRLYFEPVDSGKSTNKNRNLDESSFLSIVSGGSRHWIIPVSTICKVTEREKYTSRNRNRDTMIFELEITTRRYRVLRFQFGADMLPDRRRVQQMLRALAFPDRIDFVFAFEYARRHPCLEVIDPKKKDDDEKETQESPPTDADASDPAPVQQSGHLQPTASLLASASMPDLEVFFDAAAHKSLALTKNANVWGWNTYDIFAEFARMGIHSNDAPTKPQKQTKTKGKKHGKLGVSVDDSTPVASRDRHRGFTDSAIKSQAYRVSSVNINYEICKTYPRYLAVPAQTPDWELQQIAVFRRIGRIPVLTWKNPQNNVALFRCSQPKVGLTYQRSHLDERLLESIVSSNDCANTTEPILYIMDARPKLNANLNQMMKGAGYENDSFYKNVCVRFLNIHNIHTMRKSRKALSQIVNQAKIKDKEWLSQLERTEWLFHVREILKGTLAIVDILSAKQCSVLCHCSDGWDRTSQLCGLAELCLDPYYRTINGFIVLIEKDWLSFGHQFQYRIGHTHDAQLSEDENSPVFEQFIDCCWQLTQQFPTAFEFTSQFLSTLLEHVYSCRFGTFLCNCERERGEARLSRKTVSLWTYLQNSSRWAQFVNPFYPPKHGHVLRPQFNTKLLSFWNSYYLQHSPEHLHKSNQMFDENNELYAKHLSLKREVSRLRLLMSAQSAQIGSPIPEKVLD